jgi:hypothetical protein
MSEQTLHPPLVMAPGDGLAFARGAFVAAVMAGILAAEGVALVHLLDAAWFQAAASHLVGCALALLGVCAMGRADSGSALAGFARLIAIAMPALGPLVLLPALLAMVVRPVIVRRTVKGGALRTAIFPIIAGDTLEAEARALATSVAARSDDVVAFADVLRWGEPRQQERVVALMGREYRPAFAPLLRQALASPQPGLRAQAAAALSLAEARQALRLSELRRTAATGSSRDRLDLARHLDAMADDGLLDSLRAAELRDEAAQIYRGRVAANPDDLEAVAALGRSLVQLGRLEEAAMHMRRALGRGAATPAILGWFAECLFRLRDYNALAGFVRAHRARFEEAAAQGDGGASAVGLWLTEPGTHKADTNAAEAAAPGKGREVAEELCPANDGVAIRNVELAGHPLADPEIAEVAANDAWFDAAGVGAARPDNDAAGPAGKERAA